MNEELARIKKDVQTIQDVMGLAPSFRQDWIRWMKRDNWLNLWWCVPGLIILASALLPLNRHIAFFGLVADQWAGILVGAALLGIASLHTRQMKGKDGRPASMIRESRKTYGLTGQGLWFSLAFVIQLLVFFVWSKQHHIHFEPFWTGFFLLSGSTCLVAALTARAPILLGFALPFIGYALALPLATDAPRAQAVLFGTMFIAIALLFSAIQLWEIRKIQYDHPADQLQRA
jgi:hypothetical protein